MTDIDYLSRDYVKSPKDHPKRCTLFDNTVRQTGSWVMRKGKFITRSEARALDAKESAEKRGAVAAPYIMSDIEPYKSVIDGSEISSRSQHREHLREHGCIEVGNEKLEPAPKPAPAKDEIASDIKESIEKVKSGYVDPVEGPLTDEDTGREVKFEDRISDDIQNGDVVRADVLPEDPA